MTWYYLNEKSEPLSYSPEQAGESSGTNCSGTVPSALSRLLPTLGGSCSRDNETAHYLTASPCGTMSAHSTGDHGEGGPSASVGAFRAQISAQPEKAQALRAPSQVYGGRWRELSVRYDPASYSWKTHRCLFDEVLPWSSVTLPRSGTMLDGVCWEHIMSEHPTNETASGSWLATPTATAKSTVPVDDEMARMPGVATHSDQSRSQIRVVHPHRAAFPGSREFKGSQWWETEPDLGRVAHGVAHRVDRLRAIGNGQVPAVAALAWRVLGGP